MAFKIRYSIRARDEEIEILEYVLARFGQNKAKQVFERIENTLEQLSKNPEMYRKSGSRDGLRKCVFSKQTSIYYRIIGDYIEIISFRFNRKNLEKF